MSDYAADRLREKCLPKAVEQVWEAMRAELLPWALAEQEASP